MQGLAAAKAGALPSHPRAHGSLVLQMDRLFDSLLGGPQLKMFSKGVLCLEMMKFKSGQGSETLLTQTVDKPHDI